MCFHTIQSKIAMQIEGRFNAEIRDKKDFDSHEHINGFDFPKTPVITNEKPAIIEHYNWGIKLLQAKDIQLLQMGFMSGSGWFPKEKIKSSMKQELVMKTSLLLHDFIPTGKTILQAKFVILTPLSPQKQIH